MDVTAVWYRAQAAECAERAEKATDQNIKAINTDMAEAWLRLAELVEQLDARDSSELSAGWGPCTPSPL